MKKVPTGSLQQKNGKWYAVVNAYNYNARTRELERKPKWISTEYAATKANRSRAEIYMYEVILPEYEYETDIKTRISEVKMARLLMDYLQAWLEEKKLSIAISTYDTYQSLYSGRMTDYFGPRKICLADVTAEIIVEFYSWLQEQGLKGSTILHYHAFLSSAFKTARKRKMISENPFDCIERPRKETYVPTYYSADEARNLLILAKDSEIYVPVVLSTYYGLRRSEVLGLRWKSIDFDQGRIVINHKVIQTHRKEVLKTQTGFQMSPTCFLVAQDTMKTSSSYRTLPLIPIVAKFLQVEKVRQAEYKTLFGNCYDNRFGEYVCLQQNGTLIKPDSLTARFNALLKHLGLEQIRFHDLRHSCASILVQEGEQMKNIQMWLGHSDISTTANIYAHLEYSSKVITANAIGGLLGDNLDLPDSQFTNLMQEVSDEA